MYWSDSEGRWYRRQEFYIPNKQYVPDSGNSAYYRNPFIRDYPDEKWRIETYESIIRNEWVERLPDEEIERSFSSYLRDNTLNEHRYGNTGLWRLSLRGRTLLELLNDGDFMSKVKEGISDAEITRGIREALRLKYGRLPEDPFPPRWACFEELRVISGGSGSIDFWALHCWQSKVEAHSFEIKASRGDLLNELKKPGKRRDALMVSTHFYFVTPAGLMRPEELPAECGLMEWTGSKLVVTVKAPRRSFEGGARWTFVQALARRIVPVTGTSEG